MTICLTLLNLRVLGIGSQGLFLEKHCHCSSAFIDGLIMILYHTNVKYDNILDKFEFVVMSVPGSRSGSQWLVLEKTLSFH